jgi:hypothetical protein
VKGLRVLLVTIAGPRGQVDVAVRADVPVSELAAAVAGAVGAVSEGSMVTVEPGDGRRPTRRVPMGQTLADAGAVDGDVVLLGQENRVAGANQ